MGQTHKLTVNGQHEFQLSATDIDNLDIITTTEAAYHLLENKESYHIELITSDFRNKCYRFKINNTIYEVVIATPLDNLIESMGYVLNASNLVSTIEAPMPGLILEVSVVEGQEVKADEPLLILEAMKMENVITSPRDGIIKGINIKQGEAVEKKQTLITFE